jgi:hypothetical protein
MGKGFLFHEKIFECMYSLIKGRKKDCLVIKFRLTAKSQTIHNNALLLILSIITYNFKKKTGYLAWIPPSIHIAGLLPHPPLHICST